MFGLIKSTMLLVSKLPCDFYQRSRPASANHVFSKWFTAHTPSSRDKQDSQPAQTVLRPEPISASPAQLSSFHHLVILLTRFACANFPHLLPRVLFAEETMLPFVGWRTGGASWGLMQEVNIQGSYAFKGVWLGADAFARNHHKSDYRSHAGATTILYLHGGGFSLGSVAFYAEALLRVLNKVAQIESSSGARGKKPARCLAVEYDLSPSCRFPDPLLQCLRSYAYLLEKEELNPEDIVFAGDSAGANLAMSMLLVLNGQARSEKSLAERDWSLLPLPHKALLISPWVDLRPRKAQAFASLRRSDIGAEAKTPSAKMPASETGQRRDQPDLSDSITAYDWDYVTAETLLHFAQVYAGILPQPRRVAGPIGWFAHLCGVLSQGLKEEACPGSSKVRSTKQRSLDPARRLAKAVYAALEEPIFERLSAPETSSSAHKVPSFTAGLQPIFPRSERKTQKVASTGDLYEPFDDRTGDDGAQRLLNESALLSPAAGDWSQIQLQGGALVTWGARERLASDIEQWVEDVQSGKSPSDLDKDASSDDGPSQDGQREKEHSERRERGAWLKTATEDGPGGVHAWPFVSMYLAGTEHERERGIELLARFIARPQGAKHHLHAPRMETRAVKGQNVSHQMQEQVSDREEAGSALSSPNIARAGIGREFTEEEFMEAIGLGLVSGSDFADSTPTSVDSASESRGRLQPGFRGDAVLPSEEDTGSSTPRSLDYASAQQKAHHSRYSAQSSHPKGTTATSTDPLHGNEDYIRLLAKDAYHRLSAKDSHENTTVGGARTGDGRVTVSNDTLCGAVKLRIVLDANSSGRSPSIVLRHFLCITSK